MQKIVKDIIQEKSVPFAYTEKKEKNWQAKKKDKKKEKKLTLLRKTEAEEKREEKS